MAMRNKDAYRMRLYDFIYDILVVCPRCENRAQVNTNGYTLFQREARNVRVVCGHCGYNKVLENRSTRSKHLIIGDPLDPFFHLPLWLKIEWGDHALWAYNGAHLDFLERHVGAKLRERNGFPHQVKSIGARLPRWMTSTKNRAEVLKAIAKLKQLS